ncbi:MAG: Dihydrofolate reductase [Pseudomonadota bacterium]
MTPGAPRSSPACVTLIVARARNGVIGHRNAIPWHLPEDLRHFKAATMGHAVLMGRKTFESIGRPLPGRRIVVLSRDETWQHAGCERADSITTALQRLSDQDEVFIAGGADIYRQALQIAHRILLTEIEIEPEGDAWFPSPDPRAWECVNQTEHIGAAGLRYTISELRHRAPDRGSATIGTSPL